MPYLPLATNWEDTRAPKVSCSHQSDLKTRCSGQLASMELGIWQKLTSEPQTLESLMVPRMERHVDLLPA